MTGDLRRDVGQLLWIGFSGTELPRDIAARIAAGECGAAVLFKRNLRVTRAPGGLVDAAVAGTLGVRPGMAAGPELIDLDALTELTAAVHAAAPAGGPPVLVAVDQEGGRVQRVRAPATVWPPMLQLDRMGDAAARELARDVGHAVGAELAALGFDVDFAPVLDVHTNPANPIIGDRAFASEPARAAAHALAFAAGLADAGILACGKHFPGHGDTSTDSHLELPRLDHAMERLEAVELLPFHRAAEAGLPMIMTAHVVFAALDPGVPATLSRQAITEVLRGRLGYRGVVVSDDLDMQAIAAHHRPGDAAVAAVRAGCDALLLCRDPAAQHDAWESLVRAAEADADLRARVAESADRIRAMKRARPAVPRPDRDVIASTAHTALAEKLAGFA